MKDKMKEIWNRYKLPLLILLVGIALMLLPARKAVVANSEESMTKQSFSLPDTQAEMEAILGNIAGVGRVKVMLTLKSGTTLQLAEDIDNSDRETEKRQDSQVVKINRGSGTQEVVITNEIYPTYRGAAVVCDGADDPTVCLRITETVSVLTGLSSDKISVAKWN